MKRFIRLSTIDVMAIILGLLSSGYLFGRAATDYYEGN